MKISPIIVFAFVFAGLALFAPLKARGADSQIAALQTEIAALKSTIKQMEKDYYDVLLENMKRQNKMRAEIRRLKEELEKSAARSVENSFAPNYAEGEFGKSAKSSASAKRETFDKDAEYREAQARRAAREREESEKKAPEKTEAKEKSAEPKRESAGSSFWDNAFPF